MLRWKLWLPLSSGVWPRMRAKGAPMRTRGSPVIGKTYWTETDKTTWTGGAIAELRGN